MIMINDRLAFTFTLARPLPASQATSAVVEKLSRFQLLSKHELFIRQPLANYRHEAAHDRVQATDDCWWVRKLWPNGPMDADAGCPFQVLLTICSLQVRILM